jgi:hypothetical protein
LCRSPLHGGVAVRHELGLESGERPLLPPVGVVISYMTYFKGNIKITAEILHVYVLGRGILSYL